MLLTLLTFTALPFLSACDGKETSDTAIDEGGAADDGSLDTSDTPTDSATTDPVTSPYTGESTPGLSFSGDAPTNVLIITIDTLRRDAVGFYNGSDTTPALDVLLLNAVVLDSHRSCANWTYPSMACFFTGRYNELSGFFPQAIDRFPDEPETLAEILRDAGYDTRAVAAQAIFNTSYNLAQGYDIVASDYLWEATDVLAQVEPQAEALAAGDAPWLLHVHFLDPHVPYTAPPEYQDKLDYQGGSVDTSRRSFVDEVEAAWEGYDETQRAEVREEVAGLYHGDVRFMDEQLGRMMGILAGLGMLDDTLVVVASDHGEQFFDHGRFEHGQDLYAEETLGLAAFAAPGLTAARISAPTSHVDIAPTVLSALGRDVPAQMHGAPLGTFSSDRPVFTAIANEVEVGQSVEVQGDRLIYWWDGRAAFHALNDDPGELIDLYPALVEAGDPRLPYLLSELAPHTDAMQTVLTSETATPLE